jgi:predicted dithiol-disulfide oxidoreductase (DUF899 family)
MSSHTVATRADWEAARIELLAKEKQLTQISDEVARQRQALPWVPVENEYSFDTEHGLRSLAELFDGRSQLIVMHFMYGSDWEEGCPSCSFWADSYNGTIEHLAARDTTFVAASIAPLDQLLSYRRRMGWTFPWVSTAGTTFNHDFEVSGTARYNYAATEQPIGESHGVSVFALDDGVVHHTYSAYARGVETFNAAYQLLDLVPDGRDEAELPSTMAWLRRHDQYD